MNRLALDGLAITQPIPRLAANLGVPLRNRRHGIS